MRTPNSRLTTNLKDYRLAANMTQQELAEAVGLSTQTIIELEKNTYNPSLLVAYDLAYVFKVSIKSIFIFFDSEVDTAPICCGRKEKVNVRVEPDKRCSK
jgi:putative transcriptional regulator